jgi:hypothetical protein
LYKENEWSKGLYLYLLGIMQLQRGNVAESRKHLGLVHDACQRKVSWLQMNCFILTLFVLSVCVHGVRLAVND